MRVLFIAIKKISRKKFYPIWRGEEKDQKKPLREEKQKQKQDFDAPQYSCQMLNHSYIITRTHTKKKRKRECP